MKQNHHIARLIVGAMSIDGSLDNRELKKVAASLEKMGMEELIADIASAIEDYDSGFNMFEECKGLMQCLGSDSKDLNSLVFTIVADVIASDRFVSAQEAAYLSALGKRLKLSSAEAKSILKSVMAEKRGRLEIGARDVNEMLNPQLKELLSFEGSDRLVGEVSEDSLQELIHNAQEGMMEGEKVSLDNMERALAILGLASNASLQDAEDVWKETIANLNLPKMADLGETFVTAALQRVTRINDAYKTVLNFYNKMKEAEKAAF